MMDVKLSDEQWGAGSPPFSRRDEAARAARASSGVGLGLRCNTVGSAHGGTVALSSAVLSELQDGASEVSDLGPDRRAQASAGRFGRRNEATRSLRRHGGVRGRIVRAGEGGEAGVGKTKAGTGVKIMANRGSLRASAVVEHASCEPARGDAGATVVGLGVRGGRACEPDWRQGVRQRSFGRRIARAGRGDDRAAPAQSNAISNAGRIVVFGGRSGSGSWSGSSVGCSGSTGFWSAGSIIRRTFWRSFRCPRSACSSSTSVFEMDSSRSLTCG